MLLPMWFLVTLSIEVGVIALAHLLGVLPRR